MPRVCPNPGRPDRSPAARPSRRLCRPSAAPSSRSPPLLGQEGRRHPHLPAGQGRTAGHPGAGLRIHPRSAHNRLHAPRPRPRGALLDGYLYPVPGRGPWAEPGLRRPPGGLTPHGRGRDARRNGRRNLGLGPRRTRPDPAGRLDSHDRGAPRMAESRPGRGRFPGHPGRQDSPSRRGRPLEPRPGNRREPIRPRRRLPGFRCCGPARRPCP